MKSRRGWLFSTRSPGQDTNASFVSLHGDGGLSSGPLFHLHWGAQRYAGEGRGGRFSDQRPSHPGLRPALLSPGAVKLKPLGYPGPEERPKGATAAATH